MKRQRCFCHFCSYLGILAFLAAGFSLCLWLLPGSVQAQGGAISGPAYQLLNERVTVNQTNFYVYLDQDSGFNHGFPSGFFASPGNLGAIHLDTACIDAPQEPNGCATNSDVLDRVHGTVLRISFDPQTPGNFAGVNIEEPENWGVLRTGNGYDLRGADNVIFDVRSPDGVAIQVGVGGCTTSFFTVPSTWTTMTVGLNTLSCIPDLSNVHIVFSIATNDTHAPLGGTVLFDNIRFDPVPTSRQSALGFPLGNQTFGVVPRQNTPIPSDQALRNLTTIYETALTELALLAHGTAQDLANARLLADAFDYALHHENHGNALPVAPDGSVGLHNGYENGDLALFNSQQPPKAGQAGDVRLAGFTATALCQTTGFCLVLDGATGGNNAFAIMALVAAFEQFGVRYLNDAEIIAHWIIGNLSDHSGTGYGGYFLGYQDLGVPPPKPLLTGKSTENNSDIFAALTALATAESQRGNAGAAADWTTAANVAGDFVMQMFDAANGRFNAGTVPFGTGSGPGICPNGPQKGNDVINTCDFLDANTFTTLALAGASRYRNHIDWRQPIAYVLNHFMSSVTADGQTFNGFNLVPAQAQGSMGVAWEFTGQAVAAMRYVDQLYAQTSFETSAAVYEAEIRHAQTSAPFGDGLGLVASTLAAGDALPPADQCLATPFQCIAERVGLAATTWAIFADQNINPLGGRPTLAVSEAVTGSGTISSTPTGISCGSNCPASFSSGTEVMLTATPDTGSTFTGWSGACSSQSASATCVITMNADEAVTAHFVAAGTTPFIDVPAADSFASYIEAIYNNSITTGCGNGDYCPSEYVTRGQVAAFLVRALQVEAGQSAENSTCTGGVAGAALDCAATTPYFNDVPATDQFFPYIQKLKELGITTGCGNGQYCPTEDVTRGQMAAFIVRALYGGIAGNFTCNGGAAGASVDCATTTPYFNDVPATDQFSPYIQKIKELGITVGCGNGNFCPSERVTRDQMAAFLARAFLGMR